MSEVAPPYAPECVLISTKVEVGVGVGLGNFLNHGVILSDQISQDAFYVIVSE